MQVKDLVREDDGTTQEIILTLTASAEEVNEYARKFFDEIAQRDIPGFRKGKAPRSVLEQSVGGHANAMGGVAEKLINELAFNAIDDSGVLFINEPQFNVDEQPVEGKPFSFTVSGTVAPVMKLTSYEPVSINMPPEKASEAEIDEQILELQDHFHYLEKITDADHVAADGDYVELIMTIKNDRGRAISGLNKATRMIGLGAGTMPKSFDDQILGTKVGDILEFQFDSEMKDEGAQFGDGILSAQVEVTGFRTRIVPEIGPELAEKAGCKDMDDVRREIAYEINMQRAKDRPKMMVDRVIEKVIERLDGEVPEYYVNFIRQDVGREFMQSLEKQGTSLQQWMLQNNIDGDKMKENVANEGSRRAAIDCALEATFAHLGCELTDEDIDKMFEDEKNPAEVRAAWEEAHRMADLRKMARQSKATEWLVDNAIVTIVED